MTLFTFYRRALRLLRQDGAVTLALVVSNIAIGLVLLAEPILFGRVVDALANSRSPYDLIGAWAALGLFGIVASVVVAVFADRLAHRNRLVAMERAFERSITLPISFHARTGTGAIVRTILAGADCLFATWLAFLREQVAAFSSILLLLPVAFYMNWRLALLLVLLAGVYAVANAAVVHKTSGAQSNVEQQHIAVAGRVGDVLGNVTVVQSFSRLSAETEVLRGMIRQLLEAQYPVLTWWGVLSVLTKAAATITMVSIFAAGTWLAAHSGITVGEIVSFIGFATLLIGKLDLISGFVARLFMQAPTLQSYFALLDAPLATVESDQPHILEDPKGDVRFEDVTLRFDESDQGVFNLSFVARPGETVALVGPTGAGKTTALALLQRQRDPQSGRITIDGWDIRDISLDSLRHASAVVFQDAGLFNRSIGENIAIGKPGATQADIENAAKMAEAHGFIQKKPGGYAFIAGERGAHLSGGERQRIAIARALLKDAPLLILDEATSALDTETEARIKSALDTLRKGRTTFIIAHRLSTVASADQILVFDRGRIVEQGTFSSLSKQDGLFARLIARGDFTEPKAA